MNSKNYSSSLASLRAKTTMAAKNGYVRMRANTENDVIAACGQQLKRLKGFRNPPAPLMLLA